MDINYRKLDYSKMKKTVGSLREIIEHIRDELPSLLKFESLNELSFHALSCLEFYGDSITADEDSQILALKKFSKYFHLDSFSLPHVLQEYLTYEPLRDIFLSQALNIFSLPKDELQKLKAQVKTHLYDLNELTNHYETLGVVQDFLNTSNTPKNHLDRTIIDFYVRCKKEKQKVLEHYLNGIYERAVTKASTFVGPNNLILARFELQRDFPYDYGRGFYNHTFDYRNIDNSLHRLRDVHLAKGIELSELYKDDKASFYAQKFEIHSIEKIFDSLFEKLRLTATTYDRTPIFTELKELFNSQKWLAFYALGLPQVEGLFQEMLETQSKKIGNVNSLTLKVKQLQNVVGYRQHFFDYFQYSLPEQRNAFMHSGKLEVESQKLSAYDILTDLKFILDTFASLRNPLVSILTSIRLKPYDHFTELLGIVKYFNDLNGLTNNQLNTHKTEIQEFNSTFLIGECDLDLIAANTVGVIDELKQDYITMANMLGASDKYLHLEKLNEREQKNLKESNENELFYENDNFFELYDEIENIHTFYSGIYKYFRTYTEQKGFQESITHWNNHKLFMRNFISIFN